ncbi:MAG: hypothetical protein HY808_09615 [Nitrospirae bacterium]|nr:hypothetical protein [Nitrospirota bacterium]
MKVYSIWFIFMGVLFGSFFLTYSFAQGVSGPSSEMISNAYRQILAGADKNKDGKLSMEECMSVSRDKKKIEKDCRYWDADSDGIITEDEYVKQVKKLMR